jgi:hypothetical protein
MVPEPTRDAYTEDEVFNLLEFERAGRRAAAERQQLMFDVLRMWLPATTLRLPGTDVMLRDALRRVAERTRTRGLRDTRTNPRWIVEELEKFQESAPSEQQRELARQIVEELKAAAEFPLGELIMPPHRTPIDDVEVEVCRRRRRRLSGSTGGRRSATPSRCCTWPRSSPPSSSTASPVTSARTSSSTRTT